MKDRRVGAALSLVVFFCATLLVNTAHAATVACGTVITQDTTLDADVGPCPLFGIVVGAAGITLDLGGHTISGAPSSANGIIISQSSSSTSVRRGTVTGFTTGVLVVGDGSTVEELIVRDNGCDGIDFRTTDNSLLQRTVVSRSGCHGVRLGPGGSNLIQANVIQDNLSNGVVITPGTPSFATGANTVQGNVIKNNGASGVLLAGRFVARQTIMNNSISGNANDGIRMAPLTFNSIVRGNAVVSNRGSGVAVEREAQGNRILANYASANSVFDLYDGNPQCDSNLWTGNLFGSRNQSCVN